MSYSPAAHNTATSGRAGFVRLGSGVSGNSDGSIVSNATLLGLTASSVGLGNVTNESKATMFTSPAITGTPTGITASHVGLGTTANAQFGSLGVGTAPSGTSGRLTVSDIAFTGGGTLSTFTDWTSWPAANSVGDTSASVISAAYSILGKTVHFYIEFATNQNATVDFSLPVVSAGPACGIWVYNVPMGINVASGTWMIFNSSNILHTTQLPASSAAVDETFVIFGSYRTV